MSPTTDQPKPGDEPAGQPGGEPAKAKPAKAKRPKRGKGRIPPAKASDRERGKRYLRAKDVEGGEVAVTASDGPIRTRGAPSRLFSRLADQVGDALQGVGNLIDAPLVVAARAGASMTIVYGDPLDDDRQTSIPYHPTRESGRRIAELIDLEDEEALFARAFQMGANVQAYVDLAYLVRAENLNLRWEVLGLRRASRLSADRAGAQYELLSTPPEERVREMRIDGLLYRAIYDGPAHGRVGIRLSKQSPVPPRHRGRTVIVEYDTSEIEDQVLHKLIGQPVVADLRVVEYAPLSSVIRLKPPYPKILRVSQGRPYEPMELDWDDVDELAANE